ncbi:hypothetical protein [Streptomyces albidoflavus]|uniref:hypothetical protein n=1 Tax=Streptomyces albidoflavus TaxID=1886 RepID=UPI0033CFD076
MPESAASSSKTDAAVGKPQPLPFLLTAPQGEAARTLLSYVASLPLPEPDPQLLAVVVAVRAARGGVGNVTGMDLSALRLHDPCGAVEALRSLGWQIGDGIFKSDPAAPPVSVTVPDLARETDHPLPFGKSTRSRVSGWTTRALSAKQVKKLPPAARLAGLFAAAHSTAGLLGQIPSDLPEAARAALPHLLSKGFLTELSDEKFQLASSVRHLAGMRRPTAQESAAHPSVRTTASSGFEFRADAWAQWKDTATPALRRHAESVEYCALCALPPERVAEPFMRPAGNKFVSRNTKVAYGQWKDAHPDRGPQAANFTVAFRAEHGHGPSFRQLGEGLGWPGRPVLGFIVQRLVSNDWLTSTGQVPWTLRPGQAAQEQGITLPGSRRSVTAVGSHQP